MTCKWVFKLVAWGFNQIVDVDYQKTFNPVIKFTTAGLILSQPVSQGWCLHQLDINIVFLHRDLKEQVFMAQSPGYKSLIHPDHVCLLHRSIFTGSVNHLVYKNYVIFDCFVKSRTNTSLFVYLKPYTTNPRYTCLYKSMT